MGVNLEKHKDSLLAAWKDVVDDKTSINWALFGYEGNTTTLKVISKGDESLEEMVEEFNSGKVMYAFCKVMDPNTSLPKFVFINWQGEAAPLEIKGKCANHVTDVVRFFKGAHVTINARTEDDVDVDLIINKVAKSTVSAYNFKDRSAPEMEGTKPVGSVYKRTIPTVEINAMERDKFWEKEEAEERRRLEEERKKSEEIKQKLEEERKKRELQEAKAREEREKLRMKSIHQLREAEKQTSRTSSESDQERWEKQLLEDRQAEEERRQRRDSLCKERKEEARALISQRTINARAIFEQNTAAGQMSAKRQSFSRPSSEQNSYTNSIPTNSVDDYNDSAKSTTQMPLPKPDVIPSNPPEATSPSPEPDVATGFQQQPAATHLMNNYVPDGSMQRAQVNVDDVRLELTNEVWEDNASLNAISQEAQMAQHEYNAAYDALYNDTQIIGQCLRARALYDYQAADDTEISFDPDDIITHIEQIDEGWWQGVGPDGSFGLFPANYVELIE